MKSFFCLPAMVIGFLVLGFPVAGRAQFFKNLIDNVKNTAQGRANAKASQLTNGTLDKVDPSVSKTKSTSPTVATAAQSSTALSSTPSSSPVPSPDITATPGAGTSGSPTAAAAAAGGAGSGGSANNNSGSDSSYLQLNMSANKILLEDAVKISGNSIRYNSLKDVSLTITGPQTNFNKILPLTDSGAFNMTWQATVPGNYIVTVKSSNGKEKKTATLDVYRVVDIDSIIEDNKTGIKHAFDNLEKQVDAVKAQLAPSDLTKIGETMTKVTANKDQAVKMFTDMGKMGKDLDGLQKKYGGLPPAVSADLGKLSGLLTTQAQQIDQANSFTDHNKPTDNTICEYLVMVSEACAAFSTFTNVWAKSVGDVVRNIAIDKGAPNAIAVSGNAAGNADMSKELGKVGASVVGDVESFSSVLGGLGFAGDLAQMCSNYFLKKYCVTMSGELSENYKCTFRNKESVTYWDYSYTTSSTISLRYPKNGATGSIIKMKGNIEGNATHFDIYQKASEQDGFKDAHGNRAPLYAIQLHAPLAVPFSTSQADKATGFGAVARAIATPSYFNIPIDADYDVEGKKLKIYCNEALVDFNEYLVQYIYGYIAIAAGIPLVTRVDYPINKAKLTIAKVIEKNNEFPIKTDKDNNLSFTKSAKFDMGVGSSIEHNISFTVSAKAD